MPKTQSDLLQAARAAIAALSQNKTFPADIAAAKKWLTDAVAAAEVEENSNDTV